MKIKAIILLIIFPIIGYSQSLNVDELIKLRKMNKEDISNHLTNTNWQYGGFNEQQHWWKSDNDMLMLELAYNNGDNIIHLIAKTDSLNVSIKKQITNYKMQNIVSKKTQDGILYEVFVGKNYTIILMKTVSNVGELVIKTSLMRNETFEKYK
jgi:hypothetical protein